MIARCKDYAAYRDSQAAISRQRSRSGRDIGGIPPIADPDRREGCRLDFRRFCETYNPEACYLRWSADHLTLIDRLQECMTMGASYAIAMPRGSGKTTLCRMAVLWAVSYAHRVYPYLIGANHEKAIDSLDAIKTWMRFLPSYVADFPEIAMPVGCLAGVAQRATGQIWINPDTGEEHPTLVRWEKDRVVLPRVPPPDNSGCDARWAPTSGIVIGVSGLTGDGIRGSLFSHPDGRLVRPDFVMLDDPQTDESAHSATQNATRLNLISGAVLGMAGPDKTIAAVMPCTVIAKGDMVDEVLDRTKYPLWRGRRTKLLPSMPSDMEAVEKYLEIYRDSMGREPPNIGPANAYWIEHRETLEAGAVASWEDRKLPEEVSAIQSAMHLYARVGKHAFMAEYQNDPEEDAAVANALKPADILAKRNGSKPGEVPEWATILVTAIDVQKDVLFWLASAWDKDFNGAIVAYGAFPQQGLAYFAANDAHHTLGSAFPGKGQDGSIYAGLDTLTQQLAGRDWRRRDGTAMRLARIGVDANWGESTRVIYQFAQQSTVRSILLPCHGMGLKPTRDPKSTWKRKPEHRAASPQMRWAVVRAGGKRSVDYLLFDANHAKTFLATRWKTAMGDRGCLSLCEPTATDRMLSDHLTSELPALVEGPYGTAEVWDRIPNRDNHWLDCTTMGCMLASVEGASLYSDATPAYRQVQAGGASLASMWGR